ncbi:hypothetical protein C6361_09865 [Plantactinospora sp. BC1]|uniref:hypothetical protein n=1 Tax=Plantactinospora sp. BC1 TaxID=2108470 RepID=UPI000D174D1E|nr:hypothetical protein [Plantactinospora sp. BC1]AVT29745.1 hypothetical protein C6361_09865 [Plantactinospora sp. BC1]
MRPFRAVLLLSLLLASLAGCTPANEPLAALALRDGEPTVLLVGCGSAGASIHLYEDSETASASPSTGATADRPEWSVRTDRAEPVNEIPLLDPTPPANWTVNRSSLQRIEPGVWYGISAYGHRDAFTVRFETDAFTKLDGEHVLAPVSHRKQEVMTRASFERNARQACEDS